MKKAIVIICLFLLYKTGFAQKIECTKSEFLSSILSIDNVYKYSNNILYYSGVFKDSLILTDTLLNLGFKYNNYVTQFDTNGKLKNLQIIPFKNLDGNVSTLPFVKKRSHLICIQFQDSIQLQGIWYYSKGITDQILASYSFNGISEWVKQIGDTEIEGFGSYDINSDDNINATFGYGYSQLGTVLYPKTYVDLIDTLDFVANSYKGSTLFLQLDSNGKYVKSRSGLLTGLKSAGKYNYISTGILNGIKLTVDGISVADKTTGFTDGASAVFKMDTNFIAQYGFSVSPMNQSLTGSTGVGFTKRMFSGDALGNSYFAGIYDKCGVNVSSPIATDAILNPSKSWINNDIILVKYDSLGKLIYATSHGNVGAFDYLSSILPDDKGNLYVCGSYVEKIKFGSDSLTCPTSNMFIAKLDPMGKPIWLKQCDGAPGSVNNLVILNDTSIAALCYLQQGSSFDGIVAIKAGYHIVYFNEVNYPTKISNVEITSTNLYPNPANNYLIIEDPVENLLMYNLLGENMVVKTEQVDNFTKVQTGDLPDGIYFIKYQNNHTITTSKILIKH